jgi:hypothetical protein
MQVLFNLHTDSNRAVMPRIERTLHNMMWRLQDKWLITLWHVVVWLVFRMQGIKKRVESAHAYEADVADFHLPTGLPWPWIPQGMPVFGKHDPQLFAKDVVIGHWGEEQGKPLTFAGRVGL